jgi:hypothetical protein
MWVLYIMKNGNSKKKQSVKAHPLSGKKIRSEKATQRQKDNRTKYRERPLCFTILGHGGDEDGVIEGDRRLLKIPYAIKTPPRYYGFSNYITDVQLMGFLSESASSHPDDTLDQRIKALNQADPDMRSDDPYGKHTLWRKTKKNLICQLGDPSVFDKGGIPCQTSDQSQVTAVYTPYGIYNLDGFHRIPSKIQKPPPGIKVKGPGMKVVDPAFCKQIQSSKYNITDKVLEHALGGASPATRSHCGIKHWGNVLLSDVQVALEFLYPKRKIQIYVNLCRVYDGEHGKQIVPGTALHHKAIPHGTFKWTKELQTLENELFDIHVELMEGATPQRKKTLLAKEDVVQKNLTKIQKQISEEPMVGNLEDTFSTIDIAHTKKQKKKTRRKKKKQSLWKRFSSFMSPKKKKKKKGRHRSRRRSTSR